MIAATGSGRARNTRTRAFLASACLQLTAVLALAGQALAGPASGLPWPSGAKDGLECLARLRGRAIDVQHVHVRTPGGNWNDQVQAARGWVSAVVRSGPPVTLTSFALLPDANKGQLAACAAGRFDPYWKAIATALKAAAGTKKRVVIEPGWEANLGSGPHAWGVDDKSQLPAYKACWQHAYRAIKGVFPGATVAWTNAKYYRKNYTVWDMDPGVEDAYGLMYYDNFLPLQSQATWDRYANAKLGTGGTPTGIGAWLAYAKAHGKKLGVSEWGLWDTGEVSTAQADDPVYITNMFRFFEANAASIAYETYQNNSLSATGGHELCPGTRWPRAQGTYARLWKAG